ncbi:hypothetical protein [Clostridium sp.]|uniref:hypothetical protein n=1 Tax=Clostridium sp. TaxID=1506 RepID=UPI001A4AE676|nr:hypothetical protein [Clostridium sp.]MBK5236765.1 hypothetical protein [Clostridium sp.]
MRKCNGGGCSYQTDNRCCIDCEDSSCEAICNILKYTKPFDCEELSRNNIVEQDKKEIAEVEKAMGKAYKGYPLVGDYEVNPEIFDSKIRKLVRYSIEDED